MIARWAIPLAIIAPACLWCAAWATDVTTPTLQTTDGKSTRATLVSATVDWQLDFSVAGTSRKFSAADLVCWGQFTEAPRGQLVLLPGEGVIVVAPTLAGTASSLKFDKEQLRFESDLFGDVKLPLEMVSGILLNPPAGLADRDRLAHRVREATGDQDGLFLANGDVLTGTLSSAADDRVTLETSLGKLDFAASKVAALWFNPALAARPAFKGLHAIAGCQDGTRLQIVSLVVDAKHVALRLPGGVQLSAEPAALTALQPLAGNSIYLSDLKAASYKHVPFLELPWPYRTDRNVLDQPLRAGHQMIAKGLSMHSTARLTYDLDRDYKRFAAEVAIDDATAGGGSVIFRVLVDRGAGEWEEQFTSPIVRGNDPPLPVTVELAGCKRLALRVDFADHGDELDHADWLNARLIK